MASLLKRSAGPEANPSAPTPDDRVTILSDGADRWRALMTLIGNAKRSLRLVYYIFEHDNAGRAVRDALGQALDRGVSVELVVDGFGSDTLPPDFFETLRERGAGVCRFFPRWGRRYLLRNHQKIAIADAETDEARAIVGGFNVADDYFDDGPNGWRDLGILVEGPAAARLARYVDALTDWLHTPKAKIRALRRIIKRFSEGSGRSRWLLGGPTRRLSPWALALKRDLHTAHEAELIAGYFAPSLAMLRRLESVASRGSAQVITPAQTDHAAAIAAARHTYTRLLKRGVRIFEYQPKKLHTKLFVVDDVVYFGSANFDMRSLFLNMEIMLRVDDPALAAKTRDYLAGERAEAREVTAESHAASAGLVTRLKWSAAYFIMAVVDANVTRRLNFGVDGE